MMNLKTIITILFIFCYKFTYCTEVILVRPAQQNVGAAYAVEDFPLPDETVDRAFMDDSKESINTIENYIASLEGDEQEIQLKELLLKKAIAGSKAYIVYILMDKCRINETVLDLAKIIRKKYVDTMLSISRENNNGQEWLDRYEQASKKFEASNTIYQRLKDLFEKQELIEKEKQKKRQIAKDKKEKKVNNEILIREIRDLINKNNLEDVKKLIEDCTATLYFTDSYGRTPLMLAINDEHKEIVKFFLEKLQPTGALNDENLNITKNAENFTKELLKLKNLTERRKSNLEFIYNLLKNHNSNSGCCTIL